MRNENINIAGFHSGYFNKEEESEIINEINIKKVELLIIGMGVPKQELWIQNHSDKLKTVKITIAGGAIIDFIGNKFPRASLWIRSIGMEWFYRFLKEPKRLYKRYLIGNVNFLVKVITLFFKRKSL